MEKVDFEKKRDVADKGLSLSWTSFINLSSQKDGQNLNVIIGVKCNLKISLITESKRSNIWREI